MLHFAIPSIRHSRYIMVDLPLGACLSGKSTSLKQMRLLYGVGFTTEERKEVRRLVFSNIRVAFRIVFQQRKEWGLEYESDTSSVSIGISELLPI